MENGDVNRWVLEFLLRDRSIDSNLIKQVILKIPFPNYDSRLKIMVILRTLADYLSNVSITEPILETLEILEELYRIDGYPITAAMASAYCAVAVECTLKYLQLDLQNDSGAYLGAINRIWKGRVQYMNGSGNGEVSLMYSPELERWKNDIQVSILDSQLRERFASLDSRRDAIAKLRVFLNEARADLGPPFLHIAAYNALNAEHLEAQIHETGVQLCSSAAAEKEQLSTTNEVQKDGDCCALELQTSIKDPNKVLVENQSRDVDMPCPDDVYIEAYVDSSATAEIEHLSTTDEVQKDGDCSPLELQTSVKDLNEVLVENQSRGVYIPCPDELVIETQLCSIAAAEKEHISTTHEVQKDGDCGPLELQTSVKDPNEVLVENQSRDVDMPCPDEVFIEVQLGSSAAAEKEHLSTTNEVQKDGDCGPLELQTSVKDPNEVLVENQSRYVDIPCPDGVNDNEVDGMVNGQTSLPQNCDHRPSLMEKNSTAHTYEWDDSIDGLQDGTSDRDRLHLPTPKERKLSPLKRYDYESASIIKRRQNKKWSQLEEKTLKIAVDEFGVGNWKLILNYHKHVFGERTEVDLKDKWRNMTRYGGN